MDKSKDFTSQKSNIGLAFDPVIILLDLLRRITAVILAALIVGIGAYIYTDASYTPEYTTKTTLVITLRDSKATVYSNLTATSNIAAVFEGLLNSSILHNKVLDEVGIDSFNGRVSASRIAETNLLTVSVTDDDPRISFLVLDALIENHSIVTEDVVGDVVVEVLELAEVPRTPSNSVDARGTAVKASVLAFAAICVLVCVRSFMRDVIRSKKEAEAKLDCYCLGEIHHEKKPTAYRLFGKKKKSGLLITDPTRSFKFTEAIRKLRRRVEHGLGSGRVLMVTSVMENEGKSTVAVNLALAFAKKHERVLIIDLDMRKPSCHKLLGIPAGYLDTSAVLSGRVRLVDSIAKDPVSGLYALLQHGPVKNPADIIAHDKLEALITEARKHFKYIIVDMPPMSAAMDSEMVMEHVDASLLVVRQNYMETGVLAKAVSVLHSGRAKLIGCVVNDVFSSSLYFKSKNTYGYDGYGNYGRHKRYSESERDS